MIPNPVMRKPGSMPRILRAGPAIAPHYSRSLRAIDRSRPSSGLSPALVRGSRTGGDASAYTEVEHRSEEHTSELQSLTNLVCRLLLEKKTCALRSEEHTSVLQSLTNLVCRLLLEILIALA